MMDRSIYKDIAERTGGDIYIGVVGPVRTGKSTFIKRFMETAVIPHIDDEYKRGRAMDELPQSGAGRTVMTAEPKFIPEDGVSIALDNATLNVRMVDCVGYMVPSALGQFENDMPRMVRTPWSENEIPMVDAAELGTRKVISDHATIGVLVTTDGSITEIPREEYAEAEARVVAELKASGKPFLMLVNSIHPTDSETVELAKDLCSRYGVTALPINAQLIDDEEIKDILRGILWEFPLRYADIYLPQWCDSLPADHWLKERLFAGISAAAENMTRLKDVALAAEAASGCDSVERCRTGEIRLGEGSADIEVEIPREVFYGIINEQTGLDIKDDSSLLPIFTELATIKCAYKRVETALLEVEQKGYGIVVPGIDELTLDPPEMVKQGSQFGVRLRASAPSIHMMRADIQTTVSPVVGSEKQSEDLVNYLLKEFEGDVSKIWQSNIFGKSLHELVNEGLASKLNHLPQEAREKLRHTMERIINEGSNGLICIIL